MVWGFFIALAFLTLLATTWWIFRDHKKTTQKLDILLPPIPEAVRLDDAETMVNVKMAELEELKNQSLKNLKFDPNYKPPPSTSAELHADQIRKMTERLQEKK